MDDFQVLLIYFTPPAELSLDQLGADWGAAYLSLLAQGRTGQLPQTTATSPPISTVTAATQQEMFARAHKSQEQQAAAAAVAATLAATAKSSPHSQLSQHFHQLHAAAHSVADLSTPSSITVTKSNHMVNIHGGRTSGSPSPTNLHHHLSGLQAKISTTQLPLQSTARRSPSPNTPVHIPAPLDPIRQHSLMEDLAGAPSTPLSPYAGQQGVCVYISE